MPPDEVQNQSGGRAVALVRDLLQNLTVGVIVEIERIRAEDRVSSKTVWLVDLEVEAD